MRHRVGYGHIWVISRVFIGYGSKEIGGDKRNSEEALILIISHTDSSCPKINLSPNSCPVFSVRFRGELTPLYEIISR